MTFDNDKAVKLAKVPEELSETGEKIGIESDEEDIPEPFDPSSISIESRVVTIERLLKRLKEGSINLSPDFQRKEVWDDTRRSRLIESLMLNIPLPMFYVSSDEDGNWEVVDGAKRLSTIRNFIIGDDKGTHLKLKNLEFLGDKFDEKTFKAIEEQGKHNKFINTILNTSIQFTVINPGTPEAVKRNIFNRINTGSLSLSHQEIRHALYQGKATTLLAELVSVEAFNTAIGRKLDDSRMAARELALRFVAFRLVKRSDYQSSMDDWLSNAMRTINVLPELDNSELAKIYKQQNVVNIPEIRNTTSEQLLADFELAMTRCHKLFEGHAFRKSLPGAERKTPINKSLFEAWSNALLELDKTAFTQLLENKTKLFHIYEKVLQEETFVNYISRHASQPDSVLKRYERIMEVIEETLA